VAKFFSLPKLTSLNNKHVRRVQALRRSTRRRHEDGLMVVEGARLVREVLAAGLLVREVFYTSDFTQDDANQTLLSALSHKATAVWEVSAAVFAALSDTQTPQGILLVMPFPHFDTPSHLSLTLIPDAVRDPGNLGTMLRTAWAVGVSAVLIPFGTVDAYNPKVVRAGMGAHFHVPIVRVAWPEIADLVKHAEVWLAEAGEGTTYDEVAWHRDAVALIVGGEAQGAGDAARALAAGNLVYIPMVANVDSLNAGMATAVLLFEAARQRRNRK